MPSLSALIPATTAAALGVALLTVALVDDPPRRRGGRAAWLVCGLAFALGTLAAVELASLGRPLAALTAGGVALTGAAGVVALVRARPRGDDDDDGGSGDSRAPEPPEDPGGTVVDWAEFERAFWTYVDARERVDA
jgi:hypothetical protein